MSKTKTTAGLQYVKDFSFSPAQGFTGSAGQSQVKGYMRGGKVSRNKPNKSCKRAKGTTKAAMGGFMGPEREISVDDVTITVPKMKGGKVHNKLYAHGKKMGFARGGQVKDTSGEFKAKRGPQNPNDPGVQPARRGRTQQEIEAGGTKRLKPGFKKGGRACKKEGGYMGAATSSGGGALAEAALKKAKQALRPKKRPMKSPEKARAASRKGMPPNVKAKGGKVCYSQGGVIKKA